MTQVDGPGAGGRIIAVHHRVSSSAGAIGVWLRSAGYELDERRPKYGDPLPDELGDYCAAIVFGGPESANDDVAYMRAETEWIGTVLAAGLPYLGVCLGGQMLARLLGGQVSRHAGGFVERGYYPISATPAGERLCGPWPSFVYHWHQEGFSVPRTGTALAEGNGAFPNQAFQYGASAIGLQFHPEVNLEIIERWSRREDQLIAPGALDRPTHMAQHFNYSGEVEEWLNRFLPRWLESDQK